MFISMPHAQDGPHGRRSGDVEQRACSQDSRGSMNAVFPHTHSVAEAFGHLYARCCRTSPLSLSDLRFRGRIASVEQQPMKCSPAKTHRIVTWVDHYAAPCPRHRKPSIHPVPSMGTSSSSGFQSWAGTASEGTRFRRVQIARQSVHQPRGGVDSLGSSWDEY